MKKTLTLVALLSIATFAADYTTMSIADMQAMRGNVPTADRDAYQAEMQSRVQAMTQDQQDGLGLKAQNKVQTRTQTQMQTRTQTMQPQMQNRMQTMQQPMGGRMGGGR